MPVFEAVRMAFSTLWSQKLKSFFSLIGVLIGVTFLIAVVSIVQGMNVYMEEEFANRLVGLNTFQLRRVPDMQMGNIVKWVRTTVPVTGTTVNWSNFPRHSGVLQALHLFDPNTAITNVQVKADNYEWRNLSWNDNAYLMAQSSMTPHPSWYDVEYDYDDVPEGAGLVLDGIQDLQHNITLSDGTARNLIALCEILGPAE